MSYRPITDIWILGRPKVKYYGAYPAGFLKRARALLGADHYQDAVLHVCGGKVREYKCGPTCKEGCQHGLGVMDKTLDLDPACNPDFLQDAREPLPVPSSVIPFWRAVLIDRPYTEPDAAHYVPGADNLPEINVLLRNALKVVDTGGKVGVLDYVWPMPPKNAKEVAVVAVGTGRNNRARWFTVFEKLS